MCQAFLRELRMPRSRKATYCSFYLVTDLAPCPVGNLYQHVPSQ
jgi:hypothetical protein